MEERDYDEQDYLEDDEDELWESRHNYQRILNIDDFTFEHLKMMAAWGGRLSIGVFILAVLIVFFTLAIAVMFPQFPGVKYLGSLGFGVVGVLGACIFVYPAFELYQFSIVMSSALMYPHQGRFNTAIQHLQRMLKYMSILVIVFVLFSVIALVLWYLL